MSDQASTTSTLVGLGPIATDSFDGREKAEHSRFQSQEGWMGGKIPNCQEKSIRLVLKSVPLLLRREIQPDIPIVVPPKADEMVFD